MLAVADPRPPQSVFADLTMSGLSAGLALAARRGRAVSDYCRSFTALREPADFYALQFGYWSQMLDDYSKAFSEAVTPAAHAEPRPPGGEAMSFAPQAARPAQPAEAA